ncbi:MFS transporter [Hydrogenophaga sp. BPS33]|uniref:MFS transporter n=1 Tax=Hydrogenophaga sp. BPS33 TaxID=2651974 RepID=UPI001320541A|nr:MFS transporter [Hydrogenophaga sp. BPS33]QHE87507.1 MFS transporter [Hydrogenophaga sp. BPS33]
MTSPAPAAARAPSDLAALFRTVPFRQLLTARVAWTLGIQMVLVAIGWQMYEITRDPWALALVGLYQFVPVLIFTLPAGHAADHWSRPRIMVVCLVLQAVVAAVLAWDSWRGAVTREHLLFASVLLGAARAFQMPAVQATTPNTVPPNLLSRAMAASSTATQGSVIAGPAAGGMLLILGNDVLYAVATALLVIAMALASRLRIARHNTAARGASAQDLFAGLRFVARRPVVLGAVMLDLFAVLFGGAIALLPIFASEILEGGPSMLGWLRAAPAMGALAMSLYLMSHPPSTRVGFKLLLSVAVFGLATITFGLSKSFWLSMLALFVNGAADMVSVVIRQTLVQLETPDEMRGRVSAVNSVFIGASNQLGEFQSGSVASLIGPVAAVVVGGSATCLIAAAWPKFFPELARRKSLYADWSKAAALEKSD